LVPFDRIRIRQWVVPVAIGAYEHEKSTTQELSLDLSLEGDFQIAAASDSLGDALDYAQIKSDLEQWLVDRRWMLLEAFAQDLCLRALEHPLVQRVEVTVEKPAALAPALVSYTTVREK